VAVGEKGSELRLEKSGTIRASAKVAAMMDEKVPTTRPRYVWNIEKARIGETRTVPLELLVNGFAVERKEIVADGKLRDIDFEAKIDRSSWVALRILPSSHSNPVFVMVDGKPIRERKSLEWCLKGVDQCWSQKKGFYKDDEMNDALAAYDHARKTYQARLTEAGD
jgi:hypothetical protein